jgi:hypothetical protein
MTRILFRCLPQITPESEWKSAMWSQRQTQNKWKWELIFQILILASPHVDLHTDPRICLCHHKISHHYPHKNPFCLPSHQKTKYSMLAQIIYCHYISFQFNKNTITFICIWTFVVHSYEFLSDCWLIKMELAPWSWLVSCVVSI